MAKLAYSTDKKKKPTATTSKKATNQKELGPIKMRLETKGRGGKSVTVLFNLTPDKTEAKRIMKELQTKLGCGATYKNNTILLQGDLRDKIEEFFDKQHQKILRAGG